MERRHSTREESWDNLHYSDASSSKGDEEFNEGGLGGPDSRPASPALLTMGDVHRALHPLQATADRVGRQVEQFAETLDRLSIKKQHKSQKDCREALQIVQEYERIADDTVRRLKKYHEPERQESLKKSWRRRLRSSSGRSTPISIHEDGNDEEKLHSTLQDLQRWEQERQTWKLFGLMLQIEYPVQGSENPDSVERLNRPRPVVEIHRYSTEQDVWQQFLAEDDFAWERHVIVDWLKLSAEGSGQDVDSIIEQLDNGAERGSGLWSHGWLYSKEAIKGQKRLRSWPQALDPGSPGIDTSLVNADRTARLVTQLDPDAITRQGRSLEKQDVSFERATWLACWEFLRRGHSWESIRGWCQERVEVWRATSLRGDPRGPHSARMEGNESFHSNWQSRSLWRRMCAITAKEGGIDIFEKAVYGILSGYLPSVESVCRTWDDFLFAHYNSYLLHQFEYYLQTKFPERLPSLLIEKHSIPDPENMGGIPVLAGNELVEKLQKLDGIKEEARTPMKMLQGSLIAKKCRDFLCQFGAQLGHAANSGGKSKIMVDIQGAHFDSSLCANLDLSNHDFLRILTHIIFIFQDMGLCSEKGDCLYSLENVIVSYVDYLGKAGKQQLLPIYASRLSNNRSMECMGRQLPSILEASERTTIMKLMKQYGMNITGILNMQLQMIILDTPPNPKNTGSYPTLSILDQPGTNPNAIRPVRSGFIGHEISGDEQDLLHGFEWYMLLDGHWKETMAIGTIVYKHLLRTRGLATARELAKSVTFSNISLNKTHAILGRTIDVSRSRAASEDDSENLVDVRHSTRSRTSQLRRRRRSSSVRRTATERDILLSHSSTFRDLENLFVALDAMERWKEVADQGDRQVNPSHARDWKVEMQHAHDDLVTAVEPLLHGWLQQPKDDAEATELEEIRGACLPEIILAYISALNFDGHALSRDVLLKGLNLAATIAAEESNLIGCFVAARRMAELVDSLAITSVNILHAEEKGAKAGKKGKKSSGENPAIWTIKAPSPQQ